MNAKRKAWLAATAASMAPATIRSTAPATLRDALKVISNPDDEPLDGYHDWRCCTHSYCTIGTTHPSGLCPGHQPYANPEQKEGA